MPLSLPGKNEMEEEIKQFPQIINPAFLSRKVGVLSPICIMDSPLAREDIVLQKRQTYNIKLES